LILSQNTADLVNYFAAVSEKRWFNLSEYYSISLCERTKVFFLKANYVVINVFNKHIALNKHLYLNDYADIYQ